MAYEMIPKIDSRGYEDLIKEIAELARIHAPEWKFSPEEPDAGTALACIFASRTAETIEKLNRTPLNHKLQFYNMLGSAALPAVPASGYVRLKPGLFHKDGVCVKEGFRLFSPVIDEQGTRLTFETTREAWIVPAEIREAVFTDGGEDLLCFWDDKEKPFAPSFRCNSNQRFFRFRHGMLGSLTENCAFYMTVSGPDEKKWTQGLCDPSLTCFSRSDGDGTAELRCLNENGRIKLELMSGCDEITAEIKNIDAFDGLVFGGIQIVSEGLYLKPDNVFVNGELENSNVFYPFGEAPAVYDTVYFESFAAFSKGGAAVTLAFNVDFDVIDQGDIPELVIPNKLFVKKSQVHPAERKAVTVEEIVWEYWNGAGFAAIRGLEDCGKIFSGIREDGVPAKKTRFTLKFICPEDLSPVLIGAAQRLCVRARIKRVKNAYALPSSYYVPKLENVRISYECGCSVTDMEVLNCFEKSGCFKRLTGSAVYIGLDFPAMNFTLLFSGMRSGILKDAEWSVLTKDGWKSAGLRVSSDSSGFFSFSLPDRPAESGVFGRTACWLKAEVPEKTQIAWDRLFINCVPVTQREEIESFCSDRFIESLRLDRKNILSLRIYVNTAKKNAEEKWALLESGWELDRAEGIVRFSPALTLNPNSRTVKLNYRYGGGAAGNFPPGQEFVPALSDGSVIGAENPFSLKGGRDGEKPARTQSRLAEELRHNHRPVTAKDFEELLSDSAFSARVSANFSGGLDIEITRTFQEADAGDIENEVYSRLSEVLPVGAGRITVRVD